MVNQNALPKIFGNGFLLIALLSISGCGGCGMKSWDNGHADGYNGNVEKHGLFYGAEYHAAYAEGEEDDEIISVLKLCRCNTECAAKVLNVAPDILENWPCVK